MAVQFISGVNYFMPIFSFLFVWILVYAILAKTKVLGGNKGVDLTISILLAVFFIVNVSLVDFVKFSSAWFAIFLVCIFFILILLSFTQGNTEIISKAKWVGWVLVAALIIFFIISSSYVFTWTLNWAKIFDWFGTEWFGFVLLLIIAGVVAFVLAKK